MSLVIYTDGSCMPNPGVGGWAFVILNYDGVQYQVYGGERKTTNNRMELQAVIEALEFTPKIMDYVIYSDSMYVINCANGKWAKKKNIDLWQKYEQYSSSKNIEWRWVKSHNNDKYNELVDNLAKRSK